MGETAQKLSKKTNLLNQRMGDVKKAMGSAKKAMTPSGSTKKAITPSDSAKKEKTPSGLRHFPSGDGDGSILKLGAAFLW